MNSQKDAIQQIVRDFKKRVKDRVQTFKTDVQSTIKTHDENQIQSIREKIDKR
jgi:gas vesicle protein